MARRCRMKKSSMPATINSPIHRSDRRSLSFRNTGPITSRYAGAEHCRKTALADVVSLVAWTNRISVAAYDAAAGHVESRQPRRASGRIASNTAAAMPLRKAAVCQAVNEAILMAAPPVANSSAQRTSISAGRALRAGISIHLPRSLNAELAKVGNRSLHHRSPSPPTTKMTCPSPRTSNATRTLLRPPTTNNTRAPNEERGPVEAASALCGKRRRRGTE